MVCVYYAEIPQTLSDEIYQRYISKLPLSLRSKNKRYLREQDRLANLFGKILLLQCFFKFGYPEYWLGRICYNDNNRPYIPCGLDFNISHSGKYVICGATTDGKVGIDIEEIKPIDFREFKNVMSFNEWTQIHESDYSFVKFFKFWTIKESVIKADGCGMSVDLRNIKISDNWAIVNGVKWNLKELKIDNSYSANIAADFVIDEINLINFEIDLI